MGDLQEVANAIYRFIITEKPSPTATVLEVGYRVAEVYQATAIISFMVLTSVTSMMLEYLTDQLPVNEMGRQNELNQQLLKWKRDLAAIADCVEAINNSFGFILLCFLTKQLFNVIAFTYWLTYELKYSASFYSKTWLIVFLVKAVTYTGLIALVSHGVKRKVTHPTRPQITLDPASVIVS